jgi:hypothetical protein
MTLRVTEDEYDHLLKRNTAQERPKENKFRNVICSADGIKFRSKKERKRYIELEVMKNLGECWFLMQVPFRLPGNTKYVLDFMVYWKNGTTTFEDTKGKRTPMYIMKKKQVEELYPIRITET